MAHELKTPLSMIKISLENFLTSSKLSKEQEVEIKKVISNIQRLQNLISKLLLLSKIDYMKGNPEVIKRFKKVNLKEILENTLHEFEQYFISKEIKLKKEISKEDIFIKGDEELLEKLFFNLFLNAYKFTPEKGIVEIGLKKKSDKIIFSIKNTGTGISSDKINHIFDRFYRVDDSRSRDTGGSGLGLTICKAIVEIHNGEITVRTKEREFTEFVVNLI